MIPPKKLAFNFLVSKLSRQEQFLFKNNPKIRYNKWEMNDSLGGVRMLNMKKLLTALAISSAVLVAPVATHAADKGMSSVEEGKKLAYSRSKGNCLACHMAGEGAMPGNIGPALIAMKLRYPERSKLFDKLWGKPGTQVPNSMMPPLGAHGILTDDEINKIVDYLYTL